MGETFVQHDRRDALERRLVELRAAHPDAEPDMVADIVRAVLSTMDGDLTAKGVSLLAELEDLSRVIARTRQEIGSIEAHDINGHHIPLATDELDAIVDHTADATNAILETCETLDTVGAALDGKLALQLQAATQRIYEACSFQDIVGQRIKKVVGSLKTIDAKVAALTAALGGETLAGRQLMAQAGLAASSPTAPVPAAPPANDGSHLLNGPQLAAAAMGQSDIDKLLASFD